MKGMNKGKTSAVIAALVESLREHGSWCGETHIQKASYFLNEFAGQPLPFTYTLYKHGPYSFDLCDKLTEMRANGFLALEFQQPPYGPRYTCTSTGKENAKRFPITTKRLNNPISRVAAFFRDRGVGELERLATALYVIKTEQDKSEEDWVKMIHKLKPHIQESSAESAIQEVLNLCRDTREFSGV